MKNHRCTRAARTAMAALGWAATASANQPAAPTPQDLRIQELEREVGALRQEMRDLKTQRATTPSYNARDVDATVKAVLQDADKRSAPTGDKKWYDRINIRGYTQLRYQLFQDYTDPNFNVPADRSVGEDQTFVIRRSRLVFSGDVSDHLSLYFQLDAAASLSSDVDFTVQARDLYADISIDKDKEFRFRVGQSKVPFGWVNLQSSQNRAPFERPDAINSAVEGERDIGVFFMWAPKQAREHFKELVAKGLKGSGDYGVLALGAYSGQGLNRSDKNNETHVLARAAYPFKLPGGQFVEAGVQAYTGRFVVSTGGVDGGLTPSADPDGVRDERAGAAFVWYPQPLGVEAEWNVGRGPQLTPDASRIDDQFLHGGYVQLNYRLVEPTLGVFFPFVRWNYYDGGRKFARNAPRDLVNELDLGLEWSPWPDVELTAMYTHTIDRTNTRNVPYDDAQGDRFGLQLQFNY
jgi:hypothetical protein